jgi:hypothetical protein
MTERGELAEPVQFTWSQLDFLHHPDTLEEIVRDLGHSERVLKKQGVEYGNQRLLDRWQTVKAVIAVISDALDTHALDNTEIGETK